MSKSKKSSTKVLKAKKEVDFIPESIEKEIPSVPQRKLFTIKNVMLVIIVVVVISVLIFKDKFIAATVNGQPISKMQLSGELEKRFGSQVLDSMVNEMLILSASRQKGIFITSDDIDKKTKQVEEQLKGQMSLDDALKAQGMTKDDFKKQIEIQLSIDKMFDKEATVSDKDVDDYISKNEAVAKSSSDTAALKSQVKDMLKQQKTAELFNKWFTDIRSKASIKKNI
jgi:foldase protein PrsA